MAKSLDLESAMGHRRPARDIKNDVATTLFGDMAPQTQGQEIPVDKIVISPFYCDGPLDQAYLDTLKQTIQIGGLITPVTVRVSDSDTFELVAGRHRVEAHRQLNLPMIQATIKRMSDQEAARALTIDNAAHKRRSDYVWYKHIEMLRHTGACKTVAELADVLACSRAQIYNFDAFGQLPPEARAILDKTADDVIGGTLAYELRDYSRSHPDLVTEAVQLVADGKLKQSGVKLWLTNKVARAPRTVHRTVKLTTQGNEEVHLKFSEGEVRLRCATLNPKKLEALIAANLEDLTSD